MNNDIIQEGVNDPGIFKAIVIVGGPGSGKSTLVQTLGVKALGLKHVVSDHFFEHLLKKSGKSLDLSKAGDYSKERERARSLTNSRERHYVDGRLGVVYESSLSSVAKAAGKIKAFRQAGYEVKLVYIAVDKKVAIERNRNRDRKVPDDIVLQLHGDIAKNMKVLINIFRRKDVVVVRSGHAETDSDVRKAFKSLRTWIASPPKTAKAKAWIKAQRSGKLAESKIPPQFLSKHDDSKKKGRKGKR